MSIVDEKKGRRIGTFRVGDDDPGKSLKRDAATVPADDDNVVDLGNGGKKGRGKR